MKIISPFITELKSVLNLYFIFIVIAIGLFTFFVDGKKLSKNKLKKDSKIAKIIGLIYMIGGPLIFIIVKLV
ncbi:CLC_0170 family protein [Sporosalibacterium faouarense]|uniref:CLC_0170 family protein n=1 Tax=Sporosalibacterium faouarense TaxID=516123 RepID=UPI00141C7CDF|nr:CLC_0170 family protein [Sporosalibacterium faouarense]MTI48873.1 hypothetical protein [Bacillota bacterium]